MLVLWIALLCYCHLHCILMIPNTKYAYADGLVYQTVYRLMGECGTDVSRCSRAAGKTTGRE